MIDNQANRELALKLHYFLINAGAGLGLIIGVWAGLSAQQSTFGVTSLSYLLGLAFMWGFAKTETGSWQRGWHCGSGNTLSVLRKDHVFMLVIVANLLAMFIPTAVARARRGCT